ncbi:hypothetical protein [Halorubrum sp. CSM-61]|uniref:hypothetical protein n=1 Tax=Halorubrum sp. CSM-61 TaxID=2485838 RepID=UPI000F4BC6E7|nr:hypothetical protein [Halorubrum sp. CSM-61]
MDVRDYHHLAEEIAQQADTETLETYEDRIHYYESKNYSQIPIPDDNKYYNVDDGWIGDITLDQIIHPHTHLIDILELMEDAPFLLLDAFYGCYFLIYDGEYVTTFGTGLPDEHSTEKKEELLEKIENQYGFSEPDLLTYNELEKHYPKITDEKVDIENRYQIITLSRSHRQLRNLV